MKSSHIQFSTNQSSQKPLPEQQLFAAVLMQAFADATSVRDIREPGEVRESRTDSRRWLISKNPWFREVCWHAGFDPDVVAARAKRLAKRKWQRADLPMLRAA